MINHHIIRLHLKRIMNGKVISNHISLRRNKSPEPPFLRLLLVPEDFLLLGAPGSVRLVIKPLMLSVTVLRIPPPLFQDQEYVRFIPPLPLFVECVSLVPFPLVDVVVVFVLFPVFFELLR